MLDDSLNRQRAKRGDAKGEGEDAERKNDAENLGRHGKTPRAKLPTHKYGDCRARSQGAKPRLFSPSRDAPTFHLAARGRGFGSLAMSGQKNPKRQIPVLFSELARSLPDSLSRGSDKIIWPIH